MNHQWCSHICLILDCVAYILIVLISALSDIQTKCILWGKYYIRVILWGFFFSLFGCASTPCSFKTPRGFLIVRSFFHLLFPYQCFVHSFFKEHRETKLLNLSEQRRIQCHLYFFLIVQSDELRHIPSCDLEFIDTWKQHGGETCTGCF